MPSRLPPVCFDRVGEAPSLAVLWCCLACSSGRLVTLGVAPRASDANEVPGGIGAPVSEPVDATPSEPEPSDDTRDAAAVTPPDVDAGQQPAATLDAGAEPVRTIEPRFQTPTRVVELASDEEDENPTLTDDLLELYFTSRREGGPGNADVWFAERTAADAPFSDPAPVVEASTPEFDSSPAISSDGLTLWTAIDIDGGLGGLDIWVTTRPSRTEPWSALGNVGELNSAEDDLPRPTGDSGRVMPIQSRRDGEHYQLYLATRVSDTGPFDTPMLLENLLDEERALGDGFVTDDGLGLYFAYSANERGDLYFASRRSRDEQFVDPVALTTLNTEADERDPWLSSDGSRLYFVSSRDGNLDIYETRAEGVIP